MRLGITGDNHVLCYPAAFDCEKVMGWFEVWKVDAVVNLGDICETLLMQCFDTRSDAAMALQVLLDSSTYPVCYIPGNHDLYSYERYHPDKAMTKAVAQLRKYSTRGKTNCLHHLWKSHADKVIGDTTIVGCMGFADFGHPTLPVPPYTKQETVDADYIDLRKGWQTWAKTMLDGFEAKLIALPCTRNVVVASHYPCFEEQTRFDPNDSTSPFFFCYRLGEMLKAKAMATPDTTWYCVAGHSHEYNRGKWNQVATNVYAYGFKALYNEQNALIVDLQPDVSKLNASTVRYRTRGGIDEDARGDQAGPGSD